MLKFRLTEALCVVLVLVFIIMSVTDNTVTNKNATELSEELLSIMDDSSLSERNSVFVKEKFGIDTGIFSSFVYYSSDDVMNVNELFIGVFADKVTDDVAAAFTEYADERFILYNGYAPEQAAYLKSYVNESTSNAIIFCVGKNSDDILSAFMKAL